MILRSQMVKIWATDEMNVIVFLFIVFSFICSAREEPPTTCMRRVLKKNRANMPPVTKSTR